MRDDTPGINELCIYLIDFKDAPYKQIEYRDLMVQGLMSIFDGNATPLYLPSGLRTQGRLARDSRQNGPREQSSLSQGSLLLHQNEYVEMLIS